MYSGTGFLRLRKVRQKIVKFYPDPEGRFHDFLPCCSKGKILQINKSTNQQINKSTNQQINKSIQNIDLNPLRSIR